VKSFAVAAIVTIQIHFGTRSSIHRLLWVWSSLCAMAAADTTTTPAAAAAAHPGLTF
jgi:hypothetical protein